MPVEMHSKMEMYSYYHYIIPKAILLTIRRSRDFLLNFIVDFTVLKLLNSKTFAYNGILLLSPTDVPPKQENPTITLLD